MAINIISQPENPNCSKTNLIYNISSSNVNQPQFQYVMDVYLSSATGSADRLARIRQFPNPLTQAVFDSARIFDDNLEYYTDDFTPGISPNNTYSLLTTNQMKEFVVKFGEEYGTSPSSSVTLYPDLATGNNIQVWPCQVDPNNGFSFNLSPGLVPDSSGSILSDRPTGFNDGEGARRLMAFHNNFAGSSLYVTESYNPGSTYYHEVQQGVTLVLGTTVGVNSSGTTLSITFDGNTVERGFFDFCENPIYNFMFINRYGVWENFSTDRVTRVNTSVARNNYKQPFVNYSSGGVYNYKRRGETNFNTSVTDDYVISTNWLTQAEANWVSQLIESDNVYVAIDPGDGPTPEPAESTFFPVVITNSSYTKNTGRKDQKIFSYDINFRFANQRRGR